MDTKPLYAPRKTLSKLQRDLMKVHKVNHTPKHNRAMRKYMREGYCFQQAHDLTMKNVGK